MDIALIAALDETGGIGKDNNLLCYLPADLKHFKSLTLNHNIVMGRKTFESLPNGALPKRRNIVLTNNANYNAEGIDVVHSVEEALELCKNQEKIFIIGGASIYNLFLPKATHLHLTRINHKFVADTFFPEFNPNEWQIINEIHHQADDKNKYDFSFIDYVRDIDN